MRSDIMLAQRIRLLTLFTVDKVQFLAKDLRFSWFCIIALTKKHPLHCGISLTSNFLSLPCSTFCITQTR